MPEKVVPKAERLIAMARSNNFVERLRLVSEVKRNPELAEKLPKEVILDLLRADRTKGLNRLIPQTALYIETMTARLSDEEILDIALKVAEKIFKDWRSGNGCDVFDFGMLRNADLLRRMPKEIVEVLAAIRDREDEVINKAFDELEGRGGRANKAVEDDSQWKKLEKRMRELRRRTD